MDIKSFSKLCIISFIFTFSISHAQTCVVSKYIINEGKNAGTTNVKIVLTIYSKDKKNIEASAKLCAIRALMFNGIEKTSFHSPMVEQGEVEFKNVYPDFFISLQHIVDNYILSCEQVSEFKQGDSKKGTLFKVEVKAIQLRKFLEKNNFTKKSGI